MSKIDSLTGYTWIVSDPDLLGGQPTISGTRLMVKHVLACLAEGMSGEEIACDYPGFPPESLPEVFAFAGEQVSKFQPDATA